MAEWNYIFIDDFFITYTETDYAQSILLTAVSMISPLSIPFLVKLEDWAPAKSEHIVLVKLFSLRLVNVCTLFARSFPFPLLPLHFTLKRDSNDLSIHHHNIPNNKFRPCLLLPIVCDLF